MRLGLGNDRPGVGILWMKCDYGSNLMEIHKLGKELIKLEIDVKYERIESYF